MKLLLPCILISSSLFAQPFTTEVLDGNNVAISLNDGGTFGYNLADYESGFEFPVGSGNHLMYTTAFWFGGPDQSGQLRMCGQQYGMGTDQFKGPYNTPTPMGEPNLPYGYPEAIWTITKAEIDNHILYHLVAGYVAPESIANWPAHGDVADDEAYNLAPFIDADGDGVYDPSAGDYPDIRGDYAAYIITNDIAGTHNSTGGEPCMIEIHYMFYQYEDEGFLENTVFANVRVFNRGTLTLPEFYCANYMDIDIGNSTDDFIGCDSAKNLVYGYNGSASDPGMSGSTGYGTEVPAIGVVSLNHKLFSANTWAGSPGPHGAPSVSIEYYNKMLGLDNSGAPYIAGGSSGGFPSKFQYNGHPSSATDWNESNSMNIAGERRILGTVEPVFFAPGDVICYDFAFIVSQEEGNDYLENAEGLYDMADEVQAWYDDQWKYNCEQVTVLAANELEIENSITVFPNPSNSGFTVSAQESGEFRIISMNGEIALDGYYEPGQVIGSELSKGVYLLEMNLSTGLYQTKVIVE